MVFSKTYIQIKGLYQIGVHYEKVIAHREHVRLNRNEPDCFLGSASGFDQKTRNKMYSAPVLLNSFPQKNILVIVTLKH